MQPLSLLLVILLSAPAAWGQAFGPPAPNDRCAQAIEIQVGETITNQDNSGATLGLSMELPAMAETTCIQTPENDVWYKFKTVEGIDWYEIVIDMQGCTTPAGLQALVIRSDDCNAAHYLYRGCSNKINTDTIKLFLYAPDPNEQHLVWVDGYDGTACQFNVTLLGRPQLSPADYRFLRYDYDLRESQAELAPAPNIRFVNNAAVIRWTGNTLEPVALYLVEQLPEMPEDSKEQQYARIVGILDPNAMVGSGETTYEFEDMISEYMGKESMRYRVVKVLTDGTREASPVIKVQPELIESFFVDIPRKGEKPGSITVKYINHHKGQDFKLKVLDETGKVVKETALAKEPVRDGTVTLNMAGFPPGTYTFIMGNGKEDFRRSFHFEE